MAAINWFDDSEFEGKKISVKLKADATTEEKEKFGDAAYENGSRNGNDERGRERRQSEDKKSDDEEEGDIEAELFGFSRRGRGGSRVSSRGSRRKETKRQRKGSK